MKSPRIPSNYFAYIALMACALILFLGYGMLPEPKQIELELRQADLSAYTERLQTECQATDTAHADTLAVEKAPDPLEALPKSYQWTVDTSSGQRILLIGDSMNEYLRIRLNDYCKHNGYDLKCVIWYGATTKQFGTTDTIAHFIRQYRPTYILLNFGANELFIRDIIKKRQPYVEHILTQIGNIPFVWIGPPNWKEDTGINDLILSNVGPGRYYESRRLTLARYEDGAHPTRKAAADWTDSVAVYLTHEAIVPIRMEYPDTALKRVPPTTILAIER